jgi:hypothetical protein
VIFVELMAARSSWFLGCFLLVAVSATGCAAQPPPAAPIGTVGPTTAQLFDPVLVKPDVDGEDVYDDDATIETSNDDELVQFVRRRLERERGRLSEESRTTLLHPAEPGRSYFVRLWLERGHSVVFALRTSREVRAIVVPRTNDDRLIPSVAWMSIVLPVEGPDKKEKAAWYREILRRVATKGSATAIVLDPSGGATAVIVAMQPIPGDQSDVQLVARVRPLESGDAAQDWGPKIAATKVAIAKMNGHEGVSIKDVLARVGQPSAPPATGAASSGASLVAAGGAPADKVIPPDPSNLDRICGTYCRRLAECQPGAGVPQCDAACRERNPSKLRPYYRKDYVDASVSCMETASCAVILHSSDQCSVALRPSPSEAVVRYCTEVGKQIFDCSGRADGQAGCLKVWGPIRDDVADELARRCGSAPCATRVHCHNSAVGLPDAQR